MKVVFMGTPDFAVEVLEKIIESGNNVVGICTQADKPKGRGKKVQYSPVKECAIKYQIPVFQPIKMKTPEMVEILKNLQADIFVVVAYGKMLSKEILDIPPYGCINVHPSLLPKYRGSAPVQWAIINGDKETGVTIQQMSLECDAGDILLQHTITIEEKDTSKSLLKKISTVGAQDCVEVLKLIEQDMARPMPQDPEKVTHVDKISKDLGLIDFSKSAEEIERLIRGLNPWPGAYTFWNEKILKIEGADVLQNVIDPLDEGVEPGSVIKIYKDSIGVSTKAGGLALKKVQMEGKKSMEVKDFLLGNKIVVGDKLGVIKK